MFQPVRQAVIMVGGPGTRLLPLTETRPKPVMPVLDRPFLKYLIDSMAVAGIKDVILACGCKSDILVKEIGDGSDMGVSIIYSDEDTPLGTGGAIKNLEDRLDKVFVAANGDTLTSVDIGAQIEEHIRSGARVTLSLSYVEDPSSSGVTVTDGTGRVTAFQEKPKKEEALSHMVNSGVYVVDRDVLRYIPERTFYDFSKQLFPLLLEKGERIQGHRARGIWVDIGKPMDLIRMNLVMAERLFRGYDFSAQLRDCSVKGDFYIGRGSSMTSSKAEDVVILERSDISDAQISRSLIMKGCTVKGAEIRNSVVGERCTINKGCTVTGSVLRDGTFLAEGSTVSGKGGKV